jgi:anti-sigma B factor antagonist
LASVIDSQHRDEPVSELRPQGELDASTVPAFRESLAALVGANAVVVDLAEVPFMDSTGLGALIGGIRKLRDAGAEVVVACDRPAVLRILHTTGFDRMVSVVPTMDEARALIPPAAD